MQHGCHSPREAARQLLEHLPDPTACSQSVLTGVCTEPGAGLTLMLKIATCKTLWRLPIHDAGELFGLLQARRPVQAWQFMCEHIPCWQGPSMLTSWRVCIMTCTALARETATAAFMAIGTALRGPM